MRSITLSERNLDAKVLTFYSLVQNYAIRHWNGCYRGDFAGNGLRPEQNGTKHAEQGAAVFLFVRAVCAIEFRHQLRKRSMLRLPQDGLERGMRYCLASCHPRNFFSATTARFKQALTCLQ